MHVCGCRDNATEKEEYCLERTQQGQVYVMADMRAFAFSVSYTSEPRLAGSTFGELESSFATTRKRRPTKISNSLRFYFSQEQHRREAGLKRPSSQSWLKDSMVHGPGTLQLSATMLRKAIWQTPWRISSSTGTIVP